MDHNLRLRLRRGKAETIKAGLRQIGIGERCDLPAPGFTG